MKGEHGCENKVVFLTDTGQAKGCQGAVGWGSTVSPWLALKGEGRGGGCDLSPGLPPC